MEIMILIFIIAVGLSAIGLFIYYGTRRGENCRRYPDSCPWCHHAAECIIEIGRDKDDA